VPGALKAAAGGDAAGAPGRYALVQEVELGHRGAEVGETELARPDGGAKPSSQKPESRMPTA